MAGSRGNAPGRVRGGAPRARVGRVMAAVGQEIEQLVQMVARLPGLGPRSARRIVLRLLSEKESRLVPLIAALQTAAERVRQCSVCGALDTIDPCAVCADAGRDPVICVVESVADLWALERAGIYRGRYHVLGGLLSPVGGRGPEQLSVAPLLARLGEDAVPAIHEVILALPTTVDGQATAHYLIERLRQSGKTVSSLAQGVPVGGALEILDEGTLAMALSARRAI